MESDWTIHFGDTLTVLPTLEAGSVHCCVTSPPYWGLRDYGTAKWEGGDEACDHKPISSSRAERPANGMTGGKATVDAGSVFRGDCGKCGARRIDAQLGLEPTPDEYVARMVQVFREVRRVLRDDGTLWLNLGDSYTGAANSGATGKQDTQYRGVGLPTKSASGLKSKDLVGIPWRVAFALQADGWYLRQDIIWHKPNPMPESVRDRCTKAHEYIFLLAKSERYYYDAEAVKEASATEPHAPGNKADKEGGHLRNDFGTDSMDRVWGADGRRNRRSVWTVTTQPYKGAHFATFPPKLIEPCILAGCPVGGTVLDPFTGSGTTGAVALEHGRKFVGIELNAAYIDLAKERIGRVTPRLLPDGCGAGQ